MKSVKRSLATSIILLTLLVGMVLFGGLVNAVVSPDTAESHKIVLTMIDGNTAKTKIVSARLTSGDHPMGNQPIDFYVAADFFGKQQVKLGTVMTDAAGTATIIYEPRWEGEHTFTARCHGDGDQSPVETSQVVQFSGQITPYTPPEVGLWPVRFWSPVVLVGIVITIWALLIIVTFRTVRGIARVRSLPRKEEEKEKEQVYTTLQLTSVKRR